MGRRLPPGEAERRAAERQRAFFAGEKHKKYDPETEGYGDYAQWASAASAFINGETIFIETTFEQPKANPGNTEQPKAKPRATSTDPYLAALGLSEMPADVKALTSTYRKAVFGAFQAAGSKDTSPEYVKAFMSLTQAYDRLKARKGWK